VPNALSTPGADLIDEVGDVVHELEDSASLMLSPRRAAAVALALA
jgi:hypothetical protein